ncbi:hypothetical protein H9L10_03510 [Phycicoccus endophyticus]|uniref:Uncharacterized protein n=1 Tax=Phycicoccus endophyticus TaxID=1690220 RepID=A0A7G9R3G1_9MICO|nr:hypothetical protein [Phycicoccus endophyticus]NHI19892.1 hypothetical protein [Phycicoccus endophyticus]QNN50136.1 hypothetical protein H9L10_03510 [Phycicoccus endophyticus]GGL27721.1 hypothetical protein GCM10012283_07410 [Phycicoccus endophyticus]
MAQVVSSDGVVTAVTDEVNASVLLKVTAAIAGGSCTVYRRDVAGARVPVRSGDPCRLVDGVGVAYDHEAAPGVQYRYTAVIDEVESAAASVMLPWASACTAIVKDVRDPSLSRVVDLIHPWEESWEDPSLFLSVDEAAPPFVTEKRRAAPTGEFTVQTQGREPLERLGALLRHPGAKLLQAHPSHGVPDRWVHLGGVRQPSSGRASGYGPRDVTVAWAELDRPYHVGAHVRMPRWGWVDATAGYSDLAAVRAAYPRGVWDMMLAGVGA